jgi:hypothetical protein
MSWIAGSVAFLFLMISFYFFFQRSTEEISPQQDLEKDQS